MSPHAYFGDVWEVRLLLQRGMAALYFVAFLSVLKQFKPLLGERGLLPVPAYLEGLSFRQAPTVFHWGYSDRLLDAVAWTGLVVSGGAVLGLTEAGPLWLSVGAWLLLYVLYLSIVNVGQRFFAFGWESMLLEAGFLTAFLGPTHMQPSVLPVLMLRWMLFRTEVGAGLIKLRHDPCWRDLTCLYFHYETQPLPNPLSWYFHYMPKWSHRAGVAVSHFTQVVAPFGLFAPQPVASIAAAICTFQQVWLIVSGNYSWLNWLTAVLGVAGMSDGVLHWVLPLHAPMLAAIPVSWHALLWMLAASVVGMSIQPVLNLLSPQQIMNYSYNPFHLINTYGAFGSVGRERFEIVVEGTRDQVLTRTTEWKEYGFKAKPGDLKRLPPQVAPYHLRLDWLVWFLPFGVALRGGRIHVRGYEVWFLRFVKRLLENDRGLLTQMRVNPFAEGAPPAHVRALFYRYHYSTPAERRETGAWWTRELLGEYLPPMAAGDFDRLRMD